MKIRFGSYRGRELQDCPRTYLSWLLQQDWLSAQFRERVETTLAPDNVSCLGPRWWYLQQASAKAKTSDPKSENTALPLFATLAERAVELSAVEPPDAAAAMALHSVAVTASAALSVENIDSLADAVRTGKLPRRRTLR